MPTASPNRQKLWSYADLMALRIVYRLRHPKSGRVGEVPASPSQAVARYSKVHNRSGLSLRCNGIS